MGVALACLLASCKKENNNENKDATYFKASIEQGNGDSKTFLDPVGDVGNVKWSAGDQFKIAECTGSTTATFTLVEGEEGKEQGAEFICHGFDLEPSYTAAYPAANVSGISNGTVTFDLPATQNITATGTFGNGASPMVATGDGPELSFKNVCGGLGFPLKGIGTHVTGLRLTSNKTTDKLWGTFTVVDCTAAEPALVYSTGGSNVLEIACDVDLTNEAKWFYFILPPATLTEGFSIEVLNGDAVVYIQSTANNPNIARNVIRGVSNDIVIQNVPTGAVPGAYSVSETKIVWFAQGNLQYVGRQGWPYWRFAGHQWECLGNSSNQDSDDPYVRRDLFGWGTSGWNNGNYFYQPYNTSKQESDPYLGLIGYGYGPTDGISYTYSLINDENGYDFSKADWGVFNRNNIRDKNGVTAKSEWRTLTSDEWAYVLAWRNASTVNGTINARYAKATVNNMEGLIMFPDSYAHPSEVPQPLGINVSNASFSINNYNVEEWGLMENAGCVFLPTGGDRLGTQVRNVGYAGFYWTASSSYITDYAYCLLIRELTVSQGQYRKYEGCSVRLAVDAN